MRALVIVDVQNDFCPGGTLPVPEGDRVVEVINRIQPGFGLVVATQDWHPAAHSSFAANHPGRRPGEQIQLAGLPQILWPVHCVQGTPGADLHPGLNRSQIARVFRKGTDPNVDSYSGFFDNGRRSATGLGDYLKGQGVTEVYVCGLATDYCVKATALDAVELGFKTYLVEDACHGVELQPGDVQRAIDEMRKQGVIVTCSSDRLAGILLGTAVGDALGLPAEGLSPQRRRRLMPGGWRHRFVFGRGMVSDDTEHALFVAQSLLRHPADTDAFQRRLAWHLRWWFAGLPAGIGMATARACVKLWLGFPPGRSGVFSAGNGPAMRSALIGGYFHDQPEMLRRFVLASTQLTHTDPKAAVGAEAVARLAAWAVEHDPAEPPDAGPIVAMLAELAPQDRTWRRWIGQMETALAAGTPVPDFATSLGLTGGVTGYIYHTVPVAVYAWLRHYGDFRATLAAALDCGGDTDTLGAIAGALAGATVGEAGIPEPWLRGIIGWPRPVRLLRTVADRLGEQLRTGSPLGEVSYFWPAVLPRNVFFLLVVLCHGFRRLAPPY